MYQMPRTGSDWQAQLSIWALPVGEAILILLVAWLLARGARWAIARLVNKVPILQRHSEGDPAKSVGVLIGEVAFWLILLVGLLLALQPLGLSQVLEPVRVLTNTTFAYIPNILGAGLIFFIGLVVANIVRRLVESALLVANVDGWLRKTGLMETAGTAPATPTDAAAAPSGRPSVSRSVAMIIFFLIMIPVTIAALDALRIESISGPAREMLIPVGAAIPRIVGALVLLWIAYLGGKVLKGAIEQILPSFGFDRTMSALGISSESTTPSRTVGTVAMIAVLLFFAIKAAELLESPIIAMMLAQALELGSRVLFGTGIILVGVFIARIVASLVGGTGSSAWLPAILKWSIIALSVAMGLRFMGLANEIVIIAFASIIGSAAVACALAFGLGGRPTAHKLLEQWTKANAAPKAPAPAAPPKPPEPDNPPLI